MLINWFTVFAEAINFLILVWLLQRFLYKPILQAIDERAAGISAQLAAAEAKKSEAQQERDDFQHKNEEFDHARAALWKKSADEAQAERQRLLDVARQDADALRAKRQDALQVEQRHLNQEIIRWTQKEVFAISRKALTDLAGTSLEDRMRELFTRRLRELNADAKADFAKTLTPASEPMLVHSAFELSPEQRAAIQNALNETFAADVPVRYEVKPDVIAGIELTANGHKVSWSIAGYLARLEKSAGELLHEAAQPPSPPNGESKPVDDANAKPETSAKSQPASNGAPQRGPEPSVSTPQASA